MSMRNFVLRSALLLALMTGLSSAVHAVELAPQYAGTYLNGDGANSQWVQVTADWQGQMNSSETGIWGLQDQAAVMGLDAGDDHVIQAWSGQVDQVDFADQWYISDWGTSWGTPLLAPIFNNSGENQDNWASSFSGFIAITTAGEYNFGILYDDGFSFSLIGAGGETVSLAQDGLNARDRLGFSEDLQLSAGLYAFELNAYEHLEAGVVQLAWWTPNASEWAVIPEDSLFTSPVPEPAIPLLMLTGLAMVGWRTLKNN